MEQDDPNAKCFTDPEFYVLELKVLERLKNQVNERNIKLVCRELGVDPYDFKDRWGPMLRNHTPTEILADMAAIRPRVNDPIPDLARDLGIPPGTVRTLQRKLLITPESDHSRTKENLAHKMIAQTGGRLTDIKAQISSLSRAVARTDNGEGDKESSSSSELTLKPENVKVEKVTVVQAERRPTARQSKALGPLWYEQTIDMLTGTETRSIAPEAQIRILEEIHRGTDLQKACQRLGVEVLSFKALWGPFLRLIEPSILDASIHMIVVLSRLGYSILKIAEVLSVTKHYVQSVLHNLGFDLGPSDSCSFDVSILLVGKEQLTGSRISEICKVPSDVGKALVRRAMQREQFIKKVSDAFVDVDKAENFLWLYERGLPLGLICTAKQIALGMMKTLLPEED